MGWGNGGANLTADRSLDPPRQVAKPSFPPLGPARDRFSPIDPAQVKRDLVLFLLLAAIWQLWSGHTETLILVFGLLSCLIVTLMARRMDRTDGSFVDWMLAARSLLYVPWLLLEIVKSNLQVAGVILNPRLAIRPRLVRVKGSQKTELGQVIYANSITLTPGTITLDVRDGEFLVHALTEEAAAGVESGNMDRRVTALEGRR